jgi:D-3-phosphoglycerate dehydrogenase
MFTFWFELPPPPAVVDSLETKAAIVNPATEPPEEPFADLHRADAIIAAATLVYSEKVLDCAPRLRVISRIGVGSDNIDLVAATRRGIAVCNAPDAPTVSTAEHAIALTFAVAKQIPALCERLKLGDRTTNYFLQNRGLELSGRTFGVVGFGRIGQRVSQLARGLDMEVASYDSHPRDDVFRQRGVMRCRTLEELLAISDVVSLHLPLNPQTRRLFDRETLHRMKPGSVLINTSRGELVDEAALVEVLQSGHLFGAGLDVFATEPPEPTHPLLNLANVVATPHVASATDVSREKLWKTAVEQALDVLEGRIPRHLVNANSS